MNTKSIILILILHVTFVPMAVRNVVFGKHTPAGKLGLLKPRRPKFLEVVLILSWSFSVAYAMGEIFEQLNTSLIISAPVLASVGAILGGCIGRGMATTAGTGQYWLEFETRDENPRSVEDST